ncbi:uncharacterized protein LOC130695107 [Daphnia carinata]|uniref:uncharacterized protein LOC130695107 n=1 Tax=Daphnia carinata TaxID=120202 RepID=UPI00257A783A|nr:uncharacterized protein LOC130695107 [Daphnia carinata]
MPSACTTSMSRASRPRHRVITRSSAALIGLLILGLCEVGTVLVAKESAAAVHNGRRQLSDKAQQETWHQEKDRLRTVRRSQAGWVQAAELEHATALRDSSALSSSSATWIESFLRHQRDPVISNRAEEPSSADAAMDAVPPAYWRELDAAADEADSRSGVQQLNWHEAQLARLHGLGPAEIAALSSWQHKLRLHSLPNRLTATTGWHYQPPSFLPKNMQPLYGGPKSSLHSQQVLTSVDDADAVLANTPANSHPFAHQFVHQANQSKAEASENLLLLPLWPKRSSSDAKKSDRESNKNRNAANRKEKMEAGIGNVAPASGKGSKTKGSRKQQQQQQQQQQHVQESPHRPMSGGAVGGAGGAIQHEHSVRPSAASSSTPDVNRMNRNLATQFLLRSPRENRQYDVPIIECPPAEDGMERFACPTPDIVGRYRCIDDHVLCDGFIDCPGGEDEDGQACMFYKTMKAHLDLVADALLRWVRGR